MFLNVVSKRYQSDLNIVVQDLNFILHLEIFVHYNGQLRVSHLILGCVPSYTNYQDSSGALTISSLLLSYLDVWLRRFWPNSLTNGEARHQGHQKVREGSLEPHDGLADTVFHGRAEHILVEAPITFEPIEEMLQRCSMGLERWFPSAQPVGG